MPIIKAKNHFLGLSDHKRMNCAQAIVAAFAKEYNIDETTVEDFKHFGGGRAPDGLCGAYFAARHILRQYHSDKEKDFEDHFKSSCGSDICREIKVKHKVSCLVCVEKCAEYLSQICISGK